MDSIDFMGMTHSLPEQFQSALELAKEVDISALEETEFSSILVIGMGGSGVSGDIVSAVLSPRVQDSRERIKKLRIAWLC